MGKYIVIVSLKKQQIAKKLLNFMPERELNKKKKLTETEN